MALNLEKVAPGARGLCRGPVLKKHLRQGALKTLSWLGG